MFDCASTATSDVLCWGGGGWGQLGLGSEKDVAVPTLVSSLLGKGIQRVSCGSEHTIALGGRCDPVEEI